MDSPTKQGNAPTFKKDGTPVEIHHEGQNAKGPFKEMHIEDYRKGENYQKNHPSGSKPLKKKSEGNLPKLEVIIGKRNFLKTKYYE